jgi:uncharacterized Tic20 family protein
VEAEKLTTRSQPSRNARIVAVLCQLWCWLGPLALLALVIRCTTARRDPFLRQVTGQVLNLQIAALAPTIVGVGFVLAGLNLLALLAWLVYATVVIYGYVIGVVGAVRAWRGVEWAYPLNLHLVSG